MDASKEKELIDAVKTVGYALLSISHALTDLVSIEQQRFEKQYPVRGDVKDVTLTKLKDEETELREAQGASEETLEEWIGFRERGFANQEAHGDQPGPEKGSTAPPRRGRKPA